jgi:hypothetical protein
MVQLLSYCCGAGCAETVVKRFVWRTWTADNLDLGRGRITHALQEIQKWANRLPSESLRLTVSVQWLRLLSRPMRSLVPPLKGPKTRWRCKAIKKSLAIRSRNIAKEAPTLRRTLQPELPSLESGRASQSARCLLVSRPLASEMSIFGALAGSVSLPERKLEFPNGRGKLVPCISLNSLNVFGVVKTNSVLLD